MICYLDIETIPGEAEWVRQEVADWAEKQSPPKSIKKQETIDKWHAETLPPLVHEKRHAQGLHAETGEIVTLCCKLDNGDTMTFSRADCSEAELIDQFFDYVDLELSVNRGAVRFCGHYISGFDLPYIWRRAKILGVKVPPWLPAPIDIKAWSDNVIDTMSEWCGVRDKISLDKLCKALGIEGKNGIDGSMVWQLYLDGAQTDIDAYCRDDVEKVYQVYKRIR